MASGLRHTGISQGTAKLRSQTLDTVHVFTKSMLYKETQQANVQPVPVSHRPYHKRKCMRDQVFIEASQTCGQIERLPRDSIMAYRWRVAKTDGPIRISNELAVNFRFEFALDFNSGFTFGSTIPRHGSGSSAPLLEKECFSPDTRPPPHSARQTGLGEANCVCHQSTKK